MGGRWGAMGGGEKEAQRTSVAPDWRRAVVAMLCVCEPALTKARRFPTATQNQSRRERAIQNSARPTLSRPPLRLSSRQPLTHRATVRLRHASACASCRVPFARPSGRSSIDGTKQPRTNSKATAAKVRVTLRLPTQCESGLTEHPPRTGAQGRGC